jgi:hypothetical protein
MEAMPALPAWPSNAPFWFRAIRPLLRVLPLSSGMALDQELRRIAEVAVTYCRDGEELVGIVPAEPEVGVRLYVCAYRDGEETSWLVLGADGSAVDDRTRVRDAVSIAALYELAEEAAGKADGGEPRVATPAQLDALGMSASVVEALKQATGTIDELLRDVERGYKVPLS